MSDVNSAQGAAPVMSGRVLNVQPDVTDLRDRYYEPALLGLALTMPAPPEEQSPILNQYQEGACTGFALASAVNLLNRQRYAHLSGGGETPLLSARMLYELARLYDEWPGEDYEGSSIRGALKGFYNHGVCSDAMAPYIQGDDGWHLTRARARDARNVGLGAYYRLRPSIVDYHAAINETGVIYVSAKVHNGWNAPPGGDIAPSQSTNGGHAFIIVGYDETGFLIQNSWGESWGGFAGQPGIARWHYEDWSANVMDAWVLRLSVPTPDAFDLTIADPAGGQPNLLGVPEVKGPRAGEIAGHVIHLDDGEIYQGRTYPTPLSSIRETAEVLAGASDEDYQHLVFYAHGGLNKAGSSANRIRAMKNVFKRNGIYPIHFMWETGFVESLKDVVFSAGDKAEGRVGGLSDFFDRMIESFSRKIGTAVWRDMKRDAECSFDQNGGGLEAVKILLAGNARRANPLQVHLVGHSAGAILLGHMIGAMREISDGTDPVIRTCSLMAPACSVDLFKDKYLPNIGQDGSASGIGKLVQYNLTDQRERDDTVGPYRKSLLYFVSHAFEEQRKMPILGTEKHARNLTLKPAHTIHYAGRSPDITDATVHGGFDNDRATMNDILKTILGRAPDAELAFQEREMEGY